MKNLLSPQCANVLDNVGNEIILLLILTFMDCFHKSTNNWQVEFDDVEALSGCSTFAPAYFC